MFSKVKRSSRQLKKTYFLIAQTSSPMYLVLLISHLGNENV